MPIGGEGLSMSRRRHMVALALCAVVLLLVVASTAYIAHEAAHPHDCVGEDCPVCRFIAQIEQLRRGFYAGLLALLLWELAPAMSRGLRACRSDKVFARLLPVRMKVRLND